MELFENYLCQYTLNNISSADSQIITNKSLGTRIGVVLFCIQTTLYMISILLILVIMLDQRSKLEFWYSMCYQSILYHCVIYPGFRQLEAHCKIFSLHQQLMTAIKVCNPEPVSSQCLYWMYNIILSRNFYHPSLTDSRFIMHNVSKIRINFSTNRIVHVWW